MANKGEYVKKKRPRFWPKLLSVVALAMLFPFSCQVNQGEKPKARAGPGPEPIPKKASKSNNRVQPTEDETCSDFDDWNPGEGEMCSFKNPGNSVEPVTSCVPPPQYPVCDEPFLSEKAGKGYRERPTGPETPAPVLERASPQSLDHAPPLPPLDPGLVFHGDQSRPGSPSPLMPARPKRKPGSIRGYGTSWSRRGQRPLSFWAASGWNRTPNRPR